MADRYDRWSPAEDETLRERYASHGPHWGGWALLLPGRNVKSIYNRAHKLGLHVSPEVDGRLNNRPRRWTAEEVARLREHFPEFGWRWEGWDGLLPGRNPHAIRLKAESLGLRVLPTGEPFSDDETRVLLVSMLDVAGRLRRRPRDVAIQIARLAAEYDRKAAVRA